MQTSEKFIAWLEGYLDASKNALTTPQVKEIRKKITHYQNLQTAQVLIPLNEPAYYSLQPQIDEEFLKEIERNKNASTMEALES